MYSPDILNRLLEEAKKHRIVCIADEVFTGFGRTGKYFASDYCALKPDIMSISKGITGGAMPLGVTTCSAEIASAYETSDFTKTFFHGHSYTANPLACAAANASFKLLVSTSCQDSIKKISLSQEKFKARLVKWSCIDEVRTMGTILAIELKSPEGTSYTNPIRKRIYEFFMQRNILLRPLGNTIYILPPYVIREDELEIIYGSIEEFLAELTG